MATYTIRINERTAAGRALKAYLESLGALVGKVKSKAAKAKEQDPTLMTREEFCAKVEEAEESYRRGQTFAMLPDESFNDFRRRIRR